MHRLKFRSMCAWDIAYAIDMAVTAVITCCLMTFTRGDVQHGATCGTTDQNQVKSKRCRRATDVELSCHRSSLPAPAKAEEMRGWRRKRSRFIGSWTSNCRFGFRSHARDRLDQFEEGNATGGHAGEAESILPVRNKITAAANATLVEMARAYTAEMLTLLVAVARGEIEASPPRRWKSRARLTERRWRR
jgi:hypothetical protein